MWGEGSRHTGSKHIPSKCLGSNFPNGGVAQRIVAWTTDPIALPPLPL